MIIREFHYTSQDEYARLMCTSAAFCFIITHLTPSDESYHLKIGICDVLMQKLMKLAGDLYNSISKKCGYDLLNHEDLIDNVQIPFNYKVNYMYGHALEEIDEEFGDVIHYSKIYDHVMQAEKSAFLFTAGRHTIALTKTEQFGCTSCVLFDSIPSIVVCFTSKEDLMPLLQKSCGKFDEFNFTCIEVQ